MSNPIEVLGIDPSLRATGWCRAVFVEGKPVRFLDAGCLKTEPRKDVMQESADFQDAKFIASEISKLLVVDGAPRAAAMCIETPGGHSSKRAERAFGTLWGILATLSHITAVPVLHLPPKKIKVAVTHDRHAKKSVVEKVLRESGCVEQELLDRIDGIVDGAVVRKEKANKDHREAMFDAMAVVYAMRNSKALDMVRQAHKQMEGLLQASLKP